MQESLYIYNLFWASVGFSLLHGLFSRFSERASHCGGLLFFFFFNIEVAYSCGEPALGSTSFSSYGTWAQ